jgi:hypothetical protein
LELARNMALQIRRAELEHDRSEIIGLIRRYLAPSSNERRFAWLYCDSPHGIARAWLACDETGDTAVGMAAAFPRQMYFDGDKRLGLVLGDFCMSEKYRSIGPALSLQRACLEGIGDLPFAICYDCPSLGMMAIYKRLGIQQAGTLVRWAKPLRAERKLESVVRVKAVAKSLGAVANLALAYRGWKGGSNVCELVLQDGSCGEEFSAFDREMSWRPGVLTVRTADYLNWRYIANPIVSHQILQARYAGALVGYAVFTQHGEQADIVDLDAKEEPAVVANLLAGVVDLVRMDDVSVVNLVAGNSHPYSAVFERAGFRQRESSPVVVFTPPGSPGRSASLAALRLMQGERDS